MLFLKFMFYILTGLLGLLACYGIEAVLNKTVWKDVPDEDVE